MSQEFNAIYENGVLRPLVPVDFREHEVVSLSATSATDAAKALDIGSQQREILLAFAAKMESLDDMCPADGITNRDHDRIIYGETS